MYAFSPLEVVGSYWVSCVLESLPKLYVLGTVQRLRYVAFFLLLHLKVHLLQAIQAGYIHYAPGVIAFAPNRLVSLRMAEYLPYELLQKQTAHHVDGLFVVIVMLFTDDLPECWRNTLTSLLHGCELYDIA